MKIYAYLLCLLLLASFASAFTFEYTPNSFTLANTTQVAAFTVTIGNDQSSNDTIRLSAVDVDWTVQSDPLEDYLSGIFLMPGESRQINLFFKPTYGMTLGPKKVELLVKSQLTEELTSKYFFINVGAPEFTLKEYLAAVGKILDMPSQVDPREPFTIRLNLENKNPKNISGMLITVDSNLIKKQVTTSLYPLGSRNVAIPVALDPFTPPQSDVLRVSLIIDGKVLQPVLEEKYDIISYTNVVEKELPKQSSFLKTVEIKSYYNHGNVKAVKNVAVETNFFHRFFVSASPEAYVIYKNGKQYLSWDINLDPQETKEIRIKTDYRLLFFILVLAVLTVLFYYVFRSPVVMKKDATVIGIKEGGISELRVLIHVKNRTGNIFEKVTITDKIPHIADLDEDVEVGTLKPTKSIRQKEGLIIKWEIPSLEKYEERILSYKIKSKLTILGGFMLPRAIARFSNKGGKEKTTKSNNIMVEI